MKRRIIYGLILTALLFVPVETMNISHLHPVQVVSVSRQKNQVVIETDTKDKGVGETAELALQNLKETTGGIIYLDTAEYLLVAENARDVAEALREQLKPGVRMCGMSVPIDLKKAAEYLRIQRDLPKLKNWKTGDMLPVLDVFEVRLIFLNM